MAFFQSPELLSGNGKVMKRKALIPGEMIDEFSSFSLSPATKIRRLDAELDTNFPEEAPNSSMACEAPITEDKPLPQPDNWNESRAIVVYKPVDRTIFEYPPLLKALLRLNPDLFSMIKNDQLSSFEANKQGDREEASMALIPWAAAPESGASTVPEEEDEAGTASMDVEEEEGTKFFSANAQETGVGEDLRQWKQSCLPPQLLTPSTSTPVMWTWG